MRNGTKKECQVQTANLLKHIKKKLGRFFNYLKSVIDNYKKYKIVTQ